MLKFAIYYSLIMFLYLPLFIDDIETIFYILLIHAGAVVAVVGSIFSLIYSPSSSSVNASSLI